MASSFAAASYRFTLLASVALHLVGAAALWVAGHHSTSDRPVDVDRASTDSPTPALAGDALPIDGVAVDETSIDAVSVVTERASGDTVARTDNGSPGRGGDRDARVRALNLADVDDRVRESPDLTNELDRDQIQRLRAARERASWDDRRSTVHPAELALVAIGPGMVHERRPASPVAPSFGAGTLDRAAERGGMLEGASTPVRVNERQRDDAADPEAARPGSDRIGSQTQETGAGIRDAPLGLDHRVAAPVGEARPSVVQARVAVPASERERPRDNVDSDQEVATTVRSLVHASAAGGVMGDAEGGTGGGGAAGAGGTSGATSRARALGDGDSLDYWTDDSGFLPYYREIHRRIDPLLAHAFPKSALFDLKQGTVILEFTIYADGRVSVAWPPVRSSGVGEFDRNCADAIRRAAPFPPIPPTLHRDVLHIRAPFVASNPIVK